MVVRGLRDLRSCFDQDVGGYYASLIAMTGASGVTWDHSLEGWLVTSYALCATLLRSPNLIRQRVSLPRGERPELVECAEAILNSQMMFGTDTGPRRAYWQARIAKLRGCEEAAAVSSLSGFAEGTGIDDLYAEILQPFASRVAAGSIGLGEADRNQLYPLIWQAVRFLDGKLQTDRDFYTSMYAIVALYDRLGATYRNDPDSEAPGFNLPDLVLTLVAGHESIAYLLGTIFVQFPEPIPPREVGRAIVESLRFDSPVQLIGRRTIEPMVISERAVAADAKVYLHIGAANRDATVFRSPHTFDLHRTGTPPIAFGVGSGECIGHSLAVRAAIAFLTELDRRRSWFNVMEVHRRNGLAGRGFGRISACVVGDV